MWQFVLSIGGKQTRCSTNVELPTDVTLSTFYSETDKTVPHQKSKCLETWMIILVIWILMFELPTWHCPNLLKRHETVPHQKAKCLEIWVSKTEWLSKYFLNIINNNNNNNNIIIIMKTYKAQESVKKPLLTFVPDLSCHLN